MVKKADNYIHVSQTLLYERHNFQGEMKHTLDQKHITKGNVPNFSLTTKHVRGKCLFVGFHNGA